MAVVAKIDFPAYGPVLHVVTYKKGVDTAWITPPGNPTSSFPFYISGLDENTTYDFKVETDCGIWTTQATTGSGTLYLWIENTFQCEQDTPFMLDNTYTGFSSPQGIFWDDTSGRYYVVDVDDVNGNFWWFDPDTMTAYADANHIAGVTFSAMAAHVHDPVNRKIWAAGDNTNGVHILNLATDIVTTITYGTNGTPGSGARSPIVMGPTNMYAFSTSPNLIYLYNRATNAPDGTIDKSLIPSSGTYMTQAYQVAFVGSEAWVPASQRSDGKIAIYDDVFSSLITTIDLPTAGAATPGGAWTPNPSLYWQSHYYDADNNRWYVSDTGSSQIFIINTVTRAIVNQFVITNKRGKNFASCSFFKSQLSGEIFASVVCHNNASDGTANFKLYKINDSGITYIYPNESTTSLKLRAGTNESWGVNQGLVSWQGGAWNTDGQLFKYTES